MKILLNEYIFRTLRIFCNKKKTLATFGEWGAGVEVYACRSVGQEMEKFHRNEENWMKQLFIEIMK